MLNGVQVTEQSDQLGHIILRVYEGEFTGCEYYYDKVSFADEPNGDGTINMGFEFTITNGFVIPEGRLDTFNRFAGDNLVRVIEECASAGTTVYSGGEGGTYEE